MRYTAAQIVALDAPTLIPEEQARPRFRHDTPAGSLVLTVRRGWG